MNAGNNPQDNEDEFEFSDSGSISSSGNVYGGSSRKISERFGAESKKKILIAIAVIIIIVIGYKLVGVFLSSSPNKHNSVKASQNNHRGTQQAQAVMQAHSHINQLSQMQKTTYSRQEKLNQQVNTAHSQIVMIEQAISQLQSVVSRQNKTISVTDQSISALSNQLQHQQVLLAELLKKHGKTPGKQKNSRKNVQKALYYIRALIPGRAWLEKAGNGATTTVRIGDPLPGYGRVESINTIRGFVATTSGRVIKFSPQDS